eukprot:TRINITY_DN200_c0_g1_i1.p1 TRINITY_DN200_c0_g1~~TRINITY_DN200_c0_g1_i1.p1  ORF type:complete len:211 (+),score=48.26 TRINITY_DN200_c0_g1_i1:22-654(+)
MKGAQQFAVKPEYYEIGQKMKHYENESAIKKTLDQQIPWLVRLDGNSWSARTKPFKKPCDLILHKAMLATSKDLFVEYLPSTIYTASDEITMVFPPMESGNVLGGRLSKIISLSASFCAARFNHHLSSMATDVDDNKKTAMTSFRWYFDSRAFNVSDSEECLQNIRWRMMDCRRNSISGLAQAHFNQKILQNLNGEQMLNNFERREEHSI